jgi:hypothetical protein
MCSGLSRCCCIPSEGTNIGQGREVAIALKMQMLILSLGREMVARRQATGPLQT